MNNHTFLILFEEKYGFFMHKIKRIVLLNKKSVEIKMFEVTINQIIAMVDIKNELILIKFDKRFVILYNLNIK